MMPGRDLWNRNIPISEDVVRAIVNAVDDDSNGTETDTICRRLDESPQRLGDVLEFIKEKGILLGFGGLWFHPERIEEAVSRFLIALGEYHTSDPTNATVEPIRVARRAELNWTSKAARRIVRELVAEGRVKGDENGVRLPDFHPKISIRQQVSIERIATILDEGSFSPIGGLMLARAVNLPAQALQEALLSGEHTDRLVSIGDDIWMTPATIERAVARFREEYRDEPFTVAEARTALATSRRFAHAILMHLAQNRRAATEEGRWRLF